MSPFHHKLKAILDGQKMQLKELKMLIPKEHFRIWIHAASLGEYEMAIPLIQEIYKKNPQTEFIISFFSPSGYKNAKLEPNCKKFYLPFDTKKNAENWMKSIQPDLIIFIKYEIWPIFLRTAHSQKIPVWFWNFTLRKNHFLLKSWAGFWLSSLIPCRGFYCVNQETVDIANKIGLKNSKLLGDIRYLRTQKIQSNLDSIPQKINDFTQNASVLVLGSSWENEEKALAHALRIQKLQTNQKIIIAPHNINLENINRIKELFAFAKTYSFSNFEGQKDAEILIIDNIGLLSKLYSRANLSVVGGAFGKGLHNIIESAAAGAGVIFGPNIKKFPEAQQFLDAGIGFKAADENEMTQLILTLWLKQNSQDLQKLKEKTLAFFSNQIPQISEISDVIFVTN